MNIQEGSTFKTFQHLPFLGLQEDFYDHTIKINLNVSTFTFFQDYKKIFMGGVQVDPERDPFLM